MSGCLAVGGGRENNAVVVGVEFVRAARWRNRKFDLICTVDEQPGPTKHGLPALQLPLLTHWLASKR
jgi:hypothetical protein